MEDYKAETIIQSLIETGTVPNNKKQLVLQLDDNGQVIATYNSYGEASNQPLLILSAVIAMKSYNQTRVVGGIL